MEYRPEFLKPCLPTSFTMSSDVELTFSGTKNSAIYKSNSLPIEIDGNITHEDIVSIFDYGVILKAQDNEAKIGLNSRKRYKLALVNLDSNRSVIPERSTRLRYLQQTHQKLRT